MISSDISMQETIPMPNGVIAPSPVRKNASRMQAKRMPGLMTWLCLLLACIGASWFAYQCILVPQPRSYTPDWHGAQWIGAADGTAPVAYFRSSLELASTPDSAFITITANQTFRLYVNNTFINSNGSDFIVGGAARTYIYSVGYALHAGSNVVAIRAANDDRQAVYVRASIGVIKGGQTSYYRTNHEWQATVNTTSVYPFYAANLKTVAAWRTAQFNASAWLPAKELSSPPSSPSVTVNPSLYTDPPATGWVSVGPSPDAYYIRSISLPANSTGVWLRLCTPGIAQIFINGHLSLVWNDQSTLRQQSAASSTASQSTSRAKRSTSTTSRSTTGHPIIFLQGMYDISPFLHPGVSTLAVHVSAPGIETTTRGLETLNHTALSLDMLISDAQSHTVLLPADTGWRASRQSVPNWEQESSPTLGWRVPVSIDHPVAVRALYIGNTNTTAPQSTWLTPLSSIGNIVLLSTALVLGLWLLFSLIVLRLFSYSGRAALEITSLAFLPALAGEALLLALAREPQIPAPFPYTWFWAQVLLILVAVGYLFVLLHANSSHKRQATTPPNPYRKSFLSAFLPTASFLRNRRQTLKHVTDNPGSAHKFLCSRVLPWLRLHGVIIPLILLAIPMIFYNLSYDAYWQDELTSYSVAQGILAHGTPVFPSGFLYPKAELYSYILALSLALFGNQNGLPRIVSAVEYVLSIPLMYFVGCYFFKRRVALLASAMLALSPTSLLWGRQIRMYEQAQVLTLLVVYMFYKAVQERQRPRFIYLAMLCLLANYFSHEETFIILPALVLCVLMISKERGCFLPGVFYQKHWWYASIIAGSIIAAQLAIVYLSHPPLLGTDQSQRPLIQFTTDNMQYYYALLFLPSGRFAWATINSILATCGCLWAQRSRDPKVKYCCLFFVLSMAMLVFVFTFRADRYLVPLLPLYFLLGAWTLVEILRAFRRFARSHSVQVQPQMEGTSVALLPSRSLSRPMRALLGWTTCVVFISVLLAPILPMSNYSLFVDRVAGFPHHRYYPDYDTLGPYMQQHWRKGDIVIAIIPDTVVSYYVGHVDYFFSIDHALFLFEKNGHIVDNYTGAIALLNQHDFQAVLSKQARIWLITAANHYQTDVLKRFTFPPDFHIVFEGYDSLVYLRGS